MSAALVESATRRIRNLEDIDRGVVDFEADGIAQAPAACGAHLRRQYVGRFDLHYLIVVDIDDRTGRRAARAQFFQNGAQSRAQGTVCGMNAAMVDRRLAAAGMAGAATCASRQDFLQQRQHGNLAGRILFTADSGPAPPDLTKAAVNRGLAHTQARAPPHPRLG
jgi:hypothetical protein